MEINQATLDKAVLYWTRQLPTSAATRSFAHDLEAGLKEAAKTEKEAVKLCSNDDDLPSNDFTYVLATACSAHGIGTTAFRVAIMWVYPNQVEVKEYGDRNFKTI